MPGFAGRAQKNTPPGRAGVLKVWVMELVSSRITRHATNDTPLCRMGVGGADLQELTGKARKALYDFWQVELARRTARPRARVSGRV